MKRTAIISLVACVSLAACSGGSSSGSSSGATTPHANVLSVTPASVSFSGNSGQQATVSVAGSAGTVNFSVADPTLARVTSSGSNAFTITPIAGGATTVTFSDGAGATGTFSLSTFVCTPPSPTLDWVYPAFGSSGVSTSVQNVWFGLYNTSNPINSTIPDYYAYLIGSDGSTIQGQGIVAASGSPPSGATPPSPGYTYTYYMSAISGLKAGVTYKMQLVDSKEQCLPPHVYGSFST